MTSSTSILVLTLLAMCAEVRGHGRLLEPPSRASMWREGFNTPKNYNDNELFCGGFNNQIIHGGKCGVCGDPWQGPRDHEAGGKYATGTITRTYTQGQNVTITVQITANHKGWFEFRLCPVNNKNVKATHECLDQNLLQMANGYGTRYPIGSDSREYLVEVTLPSNLTCTQCVMQWRYHTGNSWGVDPDGRQCIGCGPQEEFYGCSDIAVIAQKEQQTTTIPRTTTSDSTTQTTTIPRTTTPDSTTQTTTIPRTTTSDSTTQTTTIPRTTTSDSTTQTTTIPRTTTPDSTTQTTTIPRTTTTDSTTQTTTIPRTTTPDSTTQTTTIPRTTTTDSTTQTTTIPRTTTSDSTTQTTVHTDTTSTASTPSPQTTSTPETSLDTCSSNIVPSDDIVSNTWCTNNCGSGVCKKVLMCV